MKTLNRALEIAAFVAAIFHVGCAPSLNVTALGTVAGTGSSGGGGGSGGTPGTVNAKKVALGDHHAFAITTAAAAQSWGGNTEWMDTIDGQLGQGLAPAAVVTSPQALNDAGTTYLSISSGQINSCGLTSTRQVKCWGENDGNASSFSSSPVLIDDAVTTYIDIASGTYHNCGVTSAGVMKCWGDGFGGKLGTGNTIAHATPVVADAGTSYTRVAAGWNHTCGITTTGALRCWGWNTSGELGDTTTTNPRLSAITTDPGVSYSAIAAGEASTCGITTARVLKCWGDNGWGQLGDGTTVSKATPTVIDAGITYSKIAVGATWNFHSCGITTAGVLKCWGGNARGQLGDGSTTPSLVPIVINSGTTYREVAVANDSTCAITTAGALQCWGDNTEGQLGLGTSGAGTQTTPAWVGSGY